jgi:dolichol-phosphate mannosyltransferase
MANEGEQTARFIADVLSYTAGFFDVRFFAVFDRVTTDGSLALARELAAREPRLSVVWAPENQNVVDAYVRGYRAALDWGADWILEIDAGYSHLPEEIPRLVAAMEQGYDCVFGSRFLSGGGFVASPAKRYWVSWGGTVLANLLLGTRQTDMTSGFELFSRAALAMVLARGIRSRAHFFQTEIKTYCRHLRFIEVPIHYHAPSPRLGAAAMSDSLLQLARLFRLRLRARL